MFEDRGSQRIFYSAPQSVTSFVAALLEPSIIVASFLAVSAWHDEPLLRAGLTLCLLVFALTFPGRNRFRDGRTEAAVDIVLSWISLLLILLLCGYATNSLYYFENDVLLTWALVTPLLQWLVVALGRQVLQRRAHLPHNRSTAIIVGAGPLGVKVARALQGRVDVRTELLGYFDDRTDDRIAPETLSSRRGMLADVAEYITAHGIKEVYITLPLGSQPRILKLLESLQGTTASLFFVPDVFGISIIQGRLRDINGVPVVGICETPFTGINELAKRLSDIVLASLILLLISPLLLVIAIGVKLSSPGPAIFKQRRNGLDGEEIVVYKFRSMTTQDNGPQVVQATRGDSRITPFGAFLRKTSLDELPQFVNVLQGRMSIVGPRPHAVAHNQMYRDLIKAYMVRHKVKPGITGWAQVNGLRGETDTIEKMRARVEYDLEYLRNWSLALDLQIIVRTIRLVFFDRQAY
ncbi:MAG TPA: undecaprenyl-phosphate glucose phosphotransferase [Methylibium sp.]|nr:undecaprenyl-phosphate glucose phosphotransferase [Methylibium sp.]